MNKKMVFFDIDGTIVHTEGQPPNQTIVEAIQKLRRNGHIACICTGRSMSMIEDEVLHVGFDGIVAACGRYVQYHGEIILDEEITGKMLKDTVAVIRDYDISCFLEGSKLRYYHNLEANKLFIKYKSFLQKYMNNSQIVPLLDNEEEMHFNKGTIGVMENHHEKIFQDKLKEYYDYIAHPNGLIEFIPKGFNKGTGVEILSNHLGIPKENLYAFGDSNNDLDMLRAVEYSVAMGNSCEEVFKIAKYTTDTVYNDGVCKGLEKLGLI